MRAAALAPGDIRGWLSLARWAASRDLVTQAREAYGHVAAWDPSNAEAQEGLGRVLVDGQWLSEEAANRARGLVEFEGRWMTLPERTSVLEARAAEAQARFADAEAAARVREAEARADAAEAEARRMAADAERAEGGIPLDPVRGYGGYGGYGGGILVADPGAIPLPPVVDHRRPHRDHHGGGHAQRPPRSRSAHRPERTAPPAPAPRRGGGDSQGDRQH